MTRNSLEEEWPALGPPKQGLTTKAAETWKSKRDLNVPEVWESTTLKGPWTKATTDQIEKDRLFAKNLQDSEYTQLNEYNQNEDDNYNPAEQNEETYEENDEDNFNPAEQEEETYEENDENNYNPAVQNEETSKKNKILFDSHHQIERLLKPYRSEPSTTRDFPHG